MKAFGVEKEKIPEEPEVGKMEIRLFAENLAPFRIFLNLTTQWIVGGLGVPVGLNYQSLESVMNIYEVKDRRSCFEKIRILECRALEKIGERRAHG